MTEQLKQYIEDLFKDTPKTKHYYDLKEEIYANLLDKYNDLVHSGVNEQEAYNIAIDSIGDVHELIESIKAGSIINPHIHNNQNRKISALIFSFGISLYVFGIIPILAIQNEIGVIISFIIWGIATGLVVYHSMTKHKYKALDATVVEQFKEFNSQNQQNKKLFKAISNCIWTLATILFLLSGFFLHNWSVAWILFLVAGLVNSIIKTVMEMRE